MAFRFLDLPIELRDKILLLGLQLPESARASHEEHKQKNGMVFVEIAKWWHTRTSRWSEVWGLLESHTRRPAPQISEDAAAKSAGSLRLVSKEFGRNLDAALMLYLRLVVSDEEQTQCKHYKEAPWDPEEYNEAVLPLPALPPLQALPLDEISFEQPLWCDKCKGLERYEQMKKEIYYQLTQNDNTLKRMSSLRTVWNGDYTVAPQYLHIKPALARLLAQEYVNDNRQGHATYLRTVHSLHEFLKRARCGFSFENRHRFWRYCECLNRLDMITDPTDTASDDIHTDDTGVYSHDILDIDATHFPSSRTWLNVHAPAPYMRHQVSICCSSNRRFNGCSRQAKYLPTSKSWRDPECGQRLDVDDIPMCELTEGCPGLNEGCPVTWRDEPLAVDRGLDDHLFAGQEMQETQEVQEMQETAEYRDLDRTLSAEQHSPRPGFDDFKWRN